MKVSIPPEILIADDDMEDIILIIEALKETRLKNNIQSVKNGEELLQYLLNKGTYSDKKKYPTPGIVLLDLNMPKKDGYEALKEIKENKHLKNIPVIILSTSNSLEDILRTYRIGANSFITKPANYVGMVEAMNNVQKYWFQTVALPFEN